MLIVPFGIEIRVGGVVVIRYHPVLIVQCGMEIDQSKRIAIGRRKC